MVSRGLLPDLEPADSLARLEARRLPDESRRLTSSSEESLSLSL